MSYRKGWGYEEYLLKHTQDWIKKYVPAGQGMSEKEFKLSRFFSDRRVRRMVYEDTNYNPILPYQHFKAKSLNESNYVRRPITVFDIETDDRGKPIAISAVRLQLNKTTGAFDIADTYQRFYEDSNRNLSESYQVHGLGSNTLRKLRAQQGATYGKRYDETEMHAFQDFIGDSIIAGHNINNYDVPHLFPKLLKNQTIDTLVAARNMNPRGENGPNTLDAVFRNLHNNVTMEGAGLSHHDAMADTVATAMVLNKYVRMKNSTGDAIRSVMQLPGLSLGYTDSYIDSQIIKGSVAEAEIADQGNYMDKDEIRKLKDIYGQNSYNDIDMSTINDLSKPDKAAGDVVSNFDELTLQIKALGDSLTHLSDQFANITEASQQISEFGNVISHRSLINQVNALANLPETEIPDAMKRMGIKGSMYELEEIEQLVNTVKARKEVGYGLSDLISLAKAGKGGTTEFMQMWNSLQTSSLWDQGAMDMRVQRALEIGNTKKKDRLLKSYASGRINGDQYEYLMNNLQNDHFDTMYEQEKRIHKEYNKGNLNTEQEINIDQELHDGIISTNDDLTKSLDDVISKTQSWNKSLQSFASIQFYDFNRVIQAGKGQASGVLNSAKGVVPQFLLDPFSRLTSAGMKSMESSLAPFRAGANIFSNVVAPIVGGAIGGVPGAMAARGVAAGASQIIGNITESNIQRKGFELQSQFDLLGASISWVSIPFKLLGKATKGLIGLFTTLGFKLRNLMDEGYGLMGGLSNPLTGFTGVDYSNFQNMEILEKGAHLGQGSINQAIEKMTQSQWMLYRTGHLDENQMLGASMLGVFSDYFSSNGSANKQEEFFDLLNKIYNNDSIAYQEKIAYTNMMDSSGTMSKILQYAQNQGLPVGSADLRTLLGAGGMSQGTKNYIDTTYASMSQVKQQQENVKMLVTADLWNLFVGDFQRGMTNALTKVANHDYSGAFNSLVDTVKDLVGNIKTIWDDIKDDVAAQGAEIVELAKKNIWDPLTEKFGSTGQGLLQTVAGVALGIYEGWNKLLEIVVKKISGAIAGLSTIHIDWKKLLKNEPGAITSIYDIKGDPSAGADTYFTPGANRSNRKWLRNYANPITDVMNPNLDYNLKGKATFHNNGQGDTYTTHEQGEYGYYGYASNGTWQYVPLGSTPGETVKEVLTNVASELGSSEYRTKYGAGGYKLNLQNGIDVLLGTNPTATELINLYSLLDQYGERNLTAAAMAEGLRNAGYKLGANGQQIMEGGNPLIPLLNTQKSITDSVLGLNDPNRIQRFTSGEWLNTAGSDAGQIVDAFNYGYNLVNPSRNPQPTQQVDINLKVNGKDSGNIATVSGDNLSTQVSSAQVMISSLDAQAVASSLGSTN